MTLMRYDGLDLSEHELKVLLKAQYLRSLSLCVCPSIHKYHSKKQEAFFSSNILFIYPSVLFIFLSLFEFECHYWL